jgi:hypothetical protein
MWDLTQLKPENEIPRKTTCPRPLLESPKRTVFNNTFQNKTDFLRFFDSRQDFGIFAFSVEASLESRQVSAKLVN